MTTERDSQVVEVLRDGSPRTATEIAKVLGLSFACHVDVPLRRLHRLGLIDRTPPDTGRVLWWYSQRSIHEG